jgi:cell division septal protein FtsQ
MRKRRKKNKPAFKKKKIFLPFLILLILGAFFYLLYISPFFQIKEIEVRGNEKTSSEKITEIAEKKTENNFLFLKTKSIFLFNIDQTVKDILSENVLIDSVGIKKNLPQKIEIEIKEREAVSTFVCNENFFLIDRKGIIFEETGEKNESFLIKYDNLEQDIFLGEKAIEEELLSEIITIKETAERLNLEPKSVIIKNERRIDFKTKEGWDIYFSLDKEIERQLIELSAFMEEGIEPEERKALEYIDLRFERLFYKISN